MTNFDLDYSEILNNDPSIPIVSLARVLNWLSIDETKWDWEEFENLEIYEHHVVRAGAGVELSAEDYILTRGGIKKLVRSLKHEDSEYILNEIGLFEFHKENNLLRKIRRAKEALINQGNYLDYTINLVKTKLNPHRTDSIRNFMRELKDKLTTSRDSEDFLESYLISRHLDKGQYITKPQMIGSESYPRWVTTFLKEDIRKGITDLISAGSLVLYKPSSGCLQLKSKEEYNEMKRKKTPLNHGVATVLLFS